MLLRECLTSLHTLVSQPTDSGTATHQLHHLGFTCFPFSKESLDALQVID